MSEMITIISGQILEEEPTMSFAELCRSCQMPAELMVKLTNLGIISPCEGSTTRQWRFSRDALIRADKALRLQRDLGVNLAGSALALELLDEIRELRRQLCRMA